MDLDDLNVSDIAPPNETDEERWKRLYARPPERYIVDDFHIGDQVHFVTSKTAAQTASGIIVDIKENVFNIYLLGDNQPGTLKEYEFPRSFYYLDLIKPTRKLNLGGFRKLVGMHVCIHLFESRRLGYITDRRDGYIYLRLTQIQGVGTVQGFMEELITDIYWTPFTRLFLDDLV